MDEKITDEARKESMNKVNPKFILRNYLLEEAIKAAEGGDYSKVHELLNFSLDPFTEENIPEEVTKDIPEWAWNICVSCSS